MLRQHCRISDIIKGGIVRWLPHERLERTKRLKRERLLRYSRALFLMFIIFCREFNVPSLFPF
jgi:hypothetical protein